METYKPLEKILVKKNVEKMTLKEQEKYYTDELKKVHRLEEYIKRQLAKVRGGTSVEAEIDRVDELILKHG